MDLSTPEIQEYLAKLPSAIRQAVESTEWSKRIGEIGQKYSLHLDQISSLEYEVLFIMIGMEPQEDFIGNIQKEVNVSAIVAGQIAEEVNERVFKYILKSVENTTEEKTEPKPERFSAAVPLSQEPIQETHEEYVVSPQNAIINENPLLSEIETMANSMPAQEVKIEQKKPYEPKIVEPPTDLPGTEPEVKPEPVQAPVSFTDAKLNTIVESKTEMPQPVQTPPTKSYGADPYREPLN